MVMHELCNKIDWEQTRQLETGITVPTGCEVKFFTWKILLGLVLISLGGQVNFNYRILIFRILYPC